MHVRYRHVVHNLHPETSRLELALGRTRKTSAIATLIGRVYMELCSDVKCPPKISGDARLDYMVIMGLERLVVNLKSKLMRSLKLKKTYDKIEKSDSMRVEIRSRKARRIVEETLKIADSPKSRTYAL
ncbi:hypothetical protein RHMOL_Rhmol10G0081400 [Rhododendron molle]|uniref:Uncharacterized protein n=1 Tax=Rhododendron molle TaxID=49168 RepID=A0ACC0M004_RHOML|nr:hypothetical protein RHMOL_Rhmol10G0081400 [Rhododendron molle]